MGMLGGGGGLYLHLQHPGAVAVAAARCTNDCSGFIHALFCVAQLVPTSKDYFFDLV